ncbi:MAG: RNA polymerase sigma factor [Bacteroidia bacterium]|nr:RNA polymerase sigma factor [Bacteroidia bacterium]HMX96487.1 RNA polymerase sigma factor [Bacteroidia bacterium]HMY13050.1 RNA polymerase sigma factor [Bacteroidia bacterium]HMY63532.1 RNA polymerase sigma factor [Bacteroidia bacterium]HNB12643.1 RNA polymerase sigma factor [Bacteroidia bacterium]
MTALEYNTCVDQYADGIYRFILHNIKNEDDARDVVQDTFEKCWRNHENVQYEKAKSYLFTTAHHTMIDRIRKSSHQELLSEYHEEPSHSKHYSDLKNVLKLALDKLPAIQKSVILLRDYEGYDYKEIGEITGLSESQVKVYIYRGRVALKEFIGSLSNVI